VNRQIGAQEGIYGRIADALIVPVCLPRRSLIFHTALPHDTSGMGVPRIMPSLDPIHTHIVEEEIHHGPQSLRHNAHVPPFATHAVTDFGFFHSVIHIYNADRANRLPDFL
jgi:hypothetical protein